MQSRAELQELNERATQSIAELEAQCRAAEDHDIIRVSGAAMVQIVDMVVGLHAALAALLPEERQRHCFCGLCVVYDGVWVGVWEGGEGNHYTRPFCFGCGAYLDPETGIARRHRDPDATRIDLLQALLMGGCGEEFVSGNEAARRLEPLLWPSTEGSVQLWHGDLRAALDAAGKEAGDDGEEIV